MLHYDTQLGLSDLESTVRATAEAIRPHLAEFDSIAVQGTSGLLIGPTVALMLGKPLVIIREDEDMRCHHSNDVENAANAGRRVLFLDDQVSSGATLRDVRDKLRAHAGAEVVASYLYQNDRYDTGASIPRQYSLDNGRSPYEALLRGYGGGGRRW
jgi:adenine/guanine phosphoribosyltransferase-like PRPP-binding protein